MKTEKKILAMCLVFLMLLPLFGCGEKPRETVAAIADMEDGSSWVLSRNKTCALSDEGYYYEYYGMLYFADTSNGIEVCLCSKPGCLHEKGSTAEAEKCEANLHGFSMLPMFFWNDHLFYMARDEFGTHVYRRDAAGMAQTMVADIGAQFTEEKKYVRPGYYAQLGDCVYYSAEVSSAVVTDQGETSLTEMNYIGRLDLKTNKEDILFATEHDMYLGAVCPEGVLVYCVETADLNYEDADYREQLYEAPSYVKFLNSKTGEITTVLSRKYRDLTGISAVRGDKLYYSRFAGNSSEVWEYEMRTGNDRKACDYDFDKQIDGRFVIKKVDGISLLYYLPAGQFLPTAFKGERLSVEAVTRDSMVLSRTIFENNVGKETTYFHVKLADLADGLQAEDTLDLYTFYYKKPAASYEDLLDQEGG